MVTRESNCTITSHEMVLPIWHADPPCAITHNGYDGMCNAVV
jgi:hypothetical protein